MSTHEIIGDYEDCQECQECQGTGLVHGDRCPECKGHGVSHVVWVKDE